MLVKKHRRQYVQVDHKIGSNAAGSHVYTHYYLVTGTVAIDKGCVLHFRMYGFYLYVSNQWKNHSKNSLSEDNDRYAILIKRSNLSRK